MMNRFFWLNFKKANSMKSYKFTINKEENSYFKNIFDTINTICPWNSTERYKVGNPVNLTLDLSKKNNDPFALFKTNYISDSDLYTTWNSFITSDKASEYFYYLNNPSYDYKVNGSYIKNHGNFIQVDNQIIPKYTTYKYFTSLKPETKTTLYNIITINNYTIAA